MPLQPDEAAREAQSVLMGGGGRPVADDLQRVMDPCGLQDVTLVGFSMGGGEVARYLARHGESRLHSVVFAAALLSFLRA